MTKKELRIAVAEACGWKLDRNGPRRDAFGSYKGFGKKSMKWIPPHGSYLGAWMKFKKSADSILPNYTKSLDACMEFEQRLVKRGGLSLYYGALINLVEKSDIIDSRMEVVVATPEQRCRAFLKIEGRL